MSSPLDRRAQVSDFVFVQEVDGEAVLLDAEGQQYFGLNEVGVRIWRLLEAGRTLAEILDVLQGEHPDVEREVLERDLTELVDALVQERLVVLEGDGDGPSPADS